jgi:RNA polymerase sigma factor (sigma-70 family)
MFEREIAQSYGLPSSLFPLLDLCRQCIAEYKFEEVREPSFEEVRVLMESKNKGSLDDIRARHVYAVLTAKEINEAEAMPYEIDETVDRRQLIETVQEVIGELPKERDRRVICMYFGIGEEKKTQKEIARELKIGQSRVWQVIFKIERKLRARLEERGTRSAA